MSTAAGSPTRSSQNEFYNRYLQHLSPEQPQLSSMSSSRVNSSNNLLSQLKGASRGFRPDEKENASPLSDMKNNPFRTFAEDKDKEKKLSFDVEKLSKNERAYYEFLCRVAEVKRWIEEVIQESLPSELDLCVGDSLRNGVYLAQVTQRINSELAPTIHPAGEKLQFKHTQNINSFFSLVDHVGLPNSFRFELQDLYNKKGLPQVFETLYILISIINKKWPTKTPSLQTLSGEITFTKEELRTCQRAWPRIRDFQSLSISPVTSPSRNKNIKSVNSGLIDDFKTFDAQQNFTPLVVTPTKEKSRLKPVTLAPPSDMEISVNLPSPDKAEIEPKSQLVPSFKPIDEDLISRSTHLDYSPLKSTSLSYFSPSISKYLTYDTDFYMRRSQARERNLEFCNSFDYGPIEYSPRRKQRMSEAEFLNNVLKIQGICRAVNLRFNLLIQRNLMMLFEKENKVLQANVRGHLIRSRASIHSVRKFYDVKIPELLTIQALFKAFLARKKLDALRIGYLRQEDRVQNLQRRLRGVVVRQRVEVLLRNVKLSDAPLRKFQALLNGKAQRTRIFGRSSSSTGQAQSTQNLQGICRGFLVRGDLREKLDRHCFELSEQRISILSVSKGFLVRSSLKNLIQSLKEYDFVISSLSAKIRASKERNSRYNIIHGDSRTFESLNSLQACIKGVLVRYTLDLVDDFVEYNHSAELQAILKGFLIRRELQERSSLFARNSRSIIMIQSKIRMFLQRTAYLDIMQSPNPRLSCVRKMAHLLNDIGTIEEIQDRLEGFQAQLDAENLKKEKLEKEIRQQMDLSDVLVQNELVDGTSSDLQSLDVPNSRYSIIEKLFYLLQVDPSYWKVMYTKFPEFARSNIYCCFSTMNQKMGEREKVFFIRLVAEILQHEISGAVNVRDFLATKNHLWRYLLIEFLRREYPAIFELFLPLLEFVSDPGIDFESDPYLIFKRIHGKDPASRSAAIENEAVKLHFIKNLRNIWHCVEIVAELFARNVNKFPIEVRFISTKIFSFAADKNAGEIDTLRGISAVFLECMVFEYINNRSHYGYEETKHHRLADKLQTVTNSLSTVFSLNEFTGYYEPLNQYAAEMNSQIKVLLFNILLDPEYEQSGDRLIYQDMISRAPCLEIFTEKVLKIGIKFQECVTYFPDEDIIHDILRNRLDTSSLPTSGRVTLDLNPTTYRFLVCDDRMRKVYDQVKRSFIYMMQVEEITTNLYDLAVSCVLPSDEPAFKTLLDSNPRLRKDPIICSLEDPPYFNLKNTTLKKIHELENMGVVNPANNKLQNFLNDIANTIKNPRYAIDYVTQELDVTHHTLSALSLVNEDLNSIFARLRKSNSCAIKAIQNTHKFAPMHKGPLGNLKGAYKKAQSRKTFELEGLKFKWTTRQLYEKGVVKSIDGEKLAEQIVKVFGSSGPRFPEIIFKISTSDGGKFGIQMVDKRKGPEKKHTDSVDSFSLKDLLNTQVGAKIETWYLFNGKVAFKTSSLLKLVVVTFLRRENSKN